MLFAAGLAVFVSTAVVHADHAWGDYHWARTAPEFTLKIGDNVSAGWDPFLITASNDWSLSNVLNTIIVPGKNLTRQKTCRAVAGQAEICNAKYGNNGWLGIASIWSSGSHIVQGTVKMNDTYFATAAYNTPAWKSLVLCQEIGHIFGLSHQDENFSNTPLGTCMDYSNNPVPNQHPNQHDYDMLETIYAHLDASTTVAQSAASALNAEPSFDENDPRGWGKEVRQSHDGRASLFERDLGGGKKVFTHVFWADADRGHGK